MNGQSLRFNLHGYQSFLVQALFETAEEMCGYATKSHLVFAGATQNEVQEEDAKALVKAGVKLVAEGANMPSDAEAIAYFHKNDVEFAPAKAANAGGVAVSGLEMAQNSARLSWTKEEVDEKLKVAPTSEHS